MRFLVNQAIETTPKEFVQFWSGQYSYRSGSLYTQNIGKPPTPRRLKKLFEWKNGRKLSAKKTHSIQRNFICRLKDLRRLTGDEEPADLFKKYRSGGAIWRTFFLHCWNPRRFPIFDQHVFRAMRFIKFGRVQELPRSDLERIKIYVEEYCDFFKTFGRPTTRRVDRALWAFGKYLKNYPTAFL